MTQNVSRRQLPMALGNDPMFDANTLAAVWVGPTGDIARSVDVRLARLEKLIDQNAAIESNSRLLG